jgi:glycosyltransferase involved in cell wall biosynthesis
VIAFLSIFPPYRGGISTFSHYLYHELEKHTSIRAYNFLKLYPDLLFPGKSQTVKFEERRYALPVLHSYNPLNWKRAAEKIAESEPDTLIYSFWHPFFAPAIWKTIKYLRKQNPQLKTMGIAHNIMPHESFPLQKWFTRNLFDQTDHVILLSSQTEIEYRALHYEKPYHHLFHPVYEQPWPKESRQKLRNRLGFDPDANILLFFGLVREYKGLDVLIEALNMTDLRKHNIYPTIVGEFYTSRQKILNRIDHHDIDRYTIVDRFVSDEEAAEYLHAADIMVLPYKTASQSGILSNAINFHLPVIVSNLPGLTEHVEHGLNGLIFETNDPGSLHDSITYYFSENGHEHYFDQMSTLKEKLSWSKFAHELLAILDHPTQE